MAEKQKPDPKNVREAAKNIKKPQTATLRYIKSVSARMLDDQKNDPEPHGRRPSPRGGSKWLG